MATTPTPSRAAYDRAVADENAAPAVDYRVSRWRFGIRDMVHYPANGKADDVQRRGKENVKHVNIE